MAALFIVIVPLILVGMGVYSAKKSGSFDKRSTMLVTIGIIMSCIVIGLFIWLKYFIQIND